MAERNFLVSAGAALAMAATPAVAADDVAASHTSERRIGAFAGATFTIPFNRRGAAAPEARLQLTMLHRITDRGSASPTRTIVSDGLALGLSRSGQVGLSLRGRTISELRQQLGFNGSTTPLIVGGAVLLGIGAYFLLFNCGDACDSQPQPAPPS